MIFGLVRWAVHNRLVVSLLGHCADRRGQLRAAEYQYRGLSRPGAGHRRGDRAVSRRRAEEVERQVTIPLEVALAGMPGLETTRSKSLFGLSHLRNQFSYGTSYKDARIEVLNRLPLADLPDGVTSARFRPRRRSAKSIAT